MNIGRLEVAIVDLGLPERKGDDLVADFAGTAVGPSNRRRYWLSRVHLAGQRILAVIPYSH
jgi:hypothetical protein